MPATELTQRKEFSWPVRVYYEDTDSGGVVYYVNYLKFMERARTELLRAIGFEQDLLQQELGLLFAVRSASIEYIKPARFNDELQVLTSISSLRKASMVFKQSVVLSSSEQSPLLLAAAEIKIACLHAEKFSPCGIPKTIIEKISQEYFCGS